MPGRVNRRVMVGLGLGPTIKLNIYNNKFEATHTTTSIQLHTAGETWRIDAIADFSLSFRFLVFFFSLVFHFISFYVRLAKSCQRQFASHKRGNFPPFLLCDAFSIKLNTSRRQSPSPKCFHLQLPSLGASFLLA